MENLKNGDIFYARIKSLEEKGYLFGVLYLIKYLNGKFFGVTVKFNEEIKKDDIINHKLIN